MMKVFNDKKLNPSKVALVLNRTEANLQTLGFRLDECLKYNQK